LEDKLLIPRGYSAEFKFHYFTMPSMITTATNVFDLKDKTVMIIPYFVAGSILAGNGFNIPAAQMLLAEYERKKAAIDTSTNRGKHTISNTKQW
jgi:hypothetical protein